MNIHMILFIAILLIAVLFMQKENQNKKLCVQIITVIMTLFSGLRSWWMGDLIKYYTLYRNCCGEEWASVVFNEFDNIGLRMFFHISGMFGLPYEFCIFAIAAFSSITLGIIVYKYSPSPFWSYAMYIGMGFYVFTFSGLKQTVAMGFIMLAFIGLAENKFRKFLVFTLLAGLFHAPAMIFIIIYPMSKKKIDWKYGIMLAAIFAVVFIFQNQIVGMLSDVYYDDATKFSSSGGIGGRFLMMLFIIAIGLFLRPLRQDDIVYVKVFNIIIFAAVLQIFSVYNNNFTRLSDYYYQFIALFLPLIMESADKRILENPELDGTFTFHDRRFYVIISVLVVAFTLYYYYGYTNENYILEQYKFMWEIDPYKLYGT